MKNAEKTYTAFGVTINELTNKFADKFDVLYEDEGAYYESKETFQHREEGLNFDYKFGVRVIDFEASCGEGNFIVQLSIVPTFNSLTEQKKQSVLDCCGIGEEDVNTMDIMDYGCMVQLGTEEVVKNEEGEEWDDNKELQEVLETTANVFETINAMRSFYLDKCVNMIGTTGWDLLYDFVDGRDFLQTTLNKYKDED